MMKKLNRIFDLVKSTRWLMLATLLSLLTAFFAVQFPIAILKITDTINAGDKQGFYSAVLFAATMLLLQGISFYGLAKSQNVFVKKNMIACRNRLYYAVMNQPFEKYLKQDPSDYSSMMINDLKLLEDDFYHAFLEMAAKIIMFAFALVQLILLSPLFLIGLLVVGVLMAIIPATFGRHIESKRKTQLEAMTHQSKILKEHFQGFLTIVQFNLRDVFYHKMSDRNTNLENANFQFKTLIAKVNTILMLTTVLLTLVTFFIGGMLVLNKVLTIGALLAAAQLIIYVSEPLVSIAQASNQLKASVPVIEKVTKFFVEKDVVHRTKLSSGEVERIEVNNVSFAFDNANDSPVITNLSLVFEKGKKYLLKGENGSGKSTLLNLIAGHLKPSYGWIGYFNNKRQLIEYTPDIAIVSQNTYLFEGSIFDNVTLFAHADVERFEVACQQSGLDQLLMQLKLGKNHRVINNGENMSGGQRQKIAIARAIYFGADILIFDEANSSLDASSSEFINKTLASFDDKLCIVVSHHEVSENHLYDHVIHLKKPA